MASPSASDTTQVDHENSAPLECAFNKARPSERVRPPLKDPTKLHYRETTVRRVIKVPVDVAASADLRKSLDRVLNKEPQRAQSRSSCTVCPDQYNPSVERHEAPALFKAFAPLTPAFFTPLRPPIPEPQMIDEVPRTLRQSAFERLVPSFEKPKHTAIQLVWFTPIPCRFLSIRARPIARIVHEIAPDQNEILFCVGQYDPPHESQLMMAPKGPIKTRLVEPRYFQLINVFVNRPQRAIAVKPTEAVRQPAHLLRADEHCAIQSLVIATVSTMVQLKETIRSSTPTALQLMNVEQDEPVLVQCVLIDDEDEPERSLPVELSSERRSAVSMSVSLEESSRELDHTSVVTIKELQVVRSGTDEDLVVVDRRAKYSSNRRRTKHDSDKSATAQSALGDVVDFLGDFIKDMGTMADRRSESAVRVDSDSYAENEPERSMSIEMDSEVQSIGRRRKVYPISALDNEQASGEPTTTGERKTLRARRSNKATRPPTSNE